MTPDLGKNRNNLERYAFGDTLIGFPLVLYGYISKGILRKDKVQLPIPPELQDFFYYNTGNINSGFVTPGLISITLRSFFELLRSRKATSNDKSKQILDYVDEHNDIIDYVSGGVYLSILLVDETIGVFGVPDLKDIPFGLIGFSLFALSRKYNGRIMNTLGIG